MIHLLPKTRGLKGAAAIGAFVAVLAAYLFAPLAVPLTPAIAAPPSAEPLPAARPQAPPAGIEPVVPGEFQSTWPSLGHYRCPEWFRDAKFGIWAHWTAQCVPEQGDWYARQMYQEGSHDYQYQVSHYGHPSRVGFKDIDRIWRAQNWDPARLIRLYKAAGAHYFVALANHHDNFDCWNSKYQPWNSVNIGPHKDIVGTWARLARQNGLRFGVTVHAARSWDWFDVSHGADTKGPLAGVPYDGVLTAADGRGQWWDGYDPAQLYGPAGAARTPAAHRAYEIKFYNRTMDLLDSYHPDLLYFDDGVPPTSYGLQIASNYYNKNEQWHGGDLQAVLTVKDATDQVRRSMVLDYERGRSEKIEEHPWQTDTCIGDWHYSRAIYENHTYKTPDQVVKMLVDIVSKNGNLLLNIPLPGDGMPDPDEFKFLRAMAAWMKVNSEAIFSTRPWKISGEGPVKVRGGGFSEGGENRFTAEDFRFTTRGNVLYATALGWPEDGHFTVRTLAAGAPGIVGKVTGVTLLGSHQRLPWKQERAGLVVTLPRTKPCEHAWALRITGLNLAASEPVPPVYAAPVIQAGRDGVIVLPAASAVLHGRLQVQPGRRENIGYWDSPQDTAAWNVEFDSPGIYTVRAVASAANGSTRAIVRIGSAVPVTLSAVRTAGWDDYHKIDAGTVEIDRAGEYTVTVGAADPADWHPMNLAEIRITRR